MPQVGRQVRALMCDLTPQVEPVSIDEAFMDLTGTERLHGMSPAQSLAGFAERVERELGITVSIGLACNKFLAKIASDLDKPRGFAVLGGERSAGVSGADSRSALIFGVGKVAQARLARDGLRTIGDLQRLGEPELARRYGSEGARLYRLAHGRDDRPVRAERETKSISAETTFDEDIADFRPLELRLWRLSEKVSARLKHAELAGSTVTLKLKSADFRIRTRAQSFEHPTQLAVEDFRHRPRPAHARNRRHEISPDRDRPFRAVRRQRGRLSDLLDHRVAEAEHAIDRLRKKFGEEAVIKGLALDLDEWMNCASASATLAAKQTTLRGGRHAHWAIEPAADRRSFRRDSRWQSPGRRNDGSVRANRVEGDRLPRPLQLLDLRRAA